MINANMPSAAASQAISGFFSISARTVATSAAMPKL